MTEEFFLFLDTETTGFSKNGNLIQPGQARVCQIAMLLTDGEGKSLNEFSSLIRPDGWVVGDGAKAVHGFSTEMCERFGINFKAMVSLYQRLASMATGIVAHNSEFDRKMMEIEEEYHTPSYKKVITPWIDTMKPNTDIVKAPHKNGGNGYKWPTLEETLVFYTGRSLGNTAHNAMYDVQACRDIFFAMRANKP